MFIFSFLGQTGDLGAQWQCGSNGDRESHFVDPDPSQEEHDYTHAKRGMIYSCQEGHDYLLHSPTGLIRTHLYWTDNRTRMQRYLAMPTSSSPQERHFAGRRPVGRGPVGRGPVGPDGQIQLRHNCPN